MRHAAPALLCCVLATASASAAERVPLDQLPKEVQEALRQHKDTDLLDARREVEGTAEFYIVGINVHGHRAEYYVSRDGGAVILRQELFSLQELPDWLLLHALFLLLPGVLGGVFGRSVVRNGYGVKLPVRTEWFAAWVGAGFAQAVLLFALSALLSRSRYEDTLGNVLVCVVWGAIAATVLELAGLLVQSVRGQRALSRRLVLGLSGLLVALICLSSAVDALMNYRENQHWKSLVVRHSANAPVRDDAP